MVTKPETGPVSGVLALLQVDFAIPEESIAQSLCRAPSQVSDVLKELEKAGLAKHTYSGWLKLPQKRKRTSKQQLWLFDGS